MTEGNFVDYAKIHLISGNGGKGSSHLRREKYVPKGGPDGGDGGRGGNIIFKANPNMWTLFNFKFKKHFRAENGGNGSKGNSSGANGKDLYIDVPLGTIFKDSSNSKFLCELSKPDQKIVLLKGGKGGKGNINFKTSRNQTPRYAQTGIPGLELTVILELKILADVGLVGYPNVGKSTLLSKITSAKPKIADYSFTTLKPNLGIVNLDNFSSYTVADIPGIIEGASRGKGLGHNFLRHIERNSVLLFLIPVDSKNLINDFTILRDELISYNEDLMDKRFAIAFTKSDLLDDELENEIKKDINKNFKNMKTILISSHSGNGIARLKFFLWEFLND